jgi:hypothetical protein
MKLVGGELSQAVGHTGHTSCSLADDAVVVIPRSNI